MMKSSAKENPPQVCIQKCSYETMDIPSLVQPFGGMKRFVQNGDRVLVKTNLLNATDPAKAVVTHPIFIKSVVESIIKAGGNVLIGDSPSGSFSKRRP